MILESLIASGPVSRVLYGACCHAPWRSFLWAADHSAAQAAYPRVLTGRAGPPLLFGLAPRGACRAADIAACAVGSYPTFSPLPNGNSCISAEGFASSRSPMLPLPAVYSLWRYP